MKFETILLTQIQPDYFFCFSTDGDSIALNSSINEMGLQTPLPVIACDKGFKLFAGFKRFEALKALKIDVIPCRVLDVEMSIDMHFANELKVHCLEKSINLLEKSRICNIISHPNFNSDARKSCLSIIELPDLKKIIDSYIRLLDLPENVQIFLSRTDVTIKQVEILRALDIVDQSKFTNWALDWNIRPVELAQIIRLCLDIAKKDRSEPFSIFNAVLSKLESSDNRTQALAQVKQMLTDIKFPQLTAWQQAMKTNKKDLKAPQCVDIAWDNTAERPGINMKIRLQSNKDLSSFKQWFDDSRVNNIIHRMVES